jgi:tRNA (mo5U34)-methyltransferase
VSDLVEKAKRFRTILDAARKAAGTAAFDWYPYNSLSSVDHLTRLLGDAHEDVLEAGKRKGILDLGCGDGDLAFFLESQGYAVTGIDYPASNQNGMRGMRALRQELGSKIAIREIDVDNEFPLDGQYGLTLCLGLLYHLKNPFFVLERVARVSQYCVLSTRIARNLPGGGSFGKHPLAYLLGEDELNHDDTNFWIFSEPGLRRLLERTRWEILEFFTTGDTKASDPASPDRDERAFCLLKSHYGGQHLDLQKGWHAVEDSGWRWTERQFVVRATSHSRVKHSSIAMRFFVPPILIETFHKITLGARIDGVDLQSLIVSEPGVHTFLRKIPTPSPTTLVTFQLDKAIGPNASDPRELGIIVASLEFI